MTRLSDLHIMIQEKIWEAVEGGAASLDEVYEFVLQYVSSDLISKETVEEMLQEYVDTSIMPL